MKRQITYSLLIGLLAWSAPASAQFILASSAGTSQPGSFSAPDSGTSTSSNTSNSGTGSASINDNSSIRTDVMEALSTDPAFRSQAVSAEVNGGVIRLSGTVSSEAEKQRAMELAQSSNRGLRVLNQITVDHSSAGRNLGA